MSSRTQVPFYDENGEPHGPVRMFGYDGRLHPEVPTASEWRAFWKDLARRSGIDPKEWKTLRDANRSAQHG